MADWKWFAHRLGENTAIAPRAFADRLRSKGFEAIKDAHGIRGRGFRGLKLTGSARDAFDASNTDDL